MCAKGQDFSQALSLYQRALTFVEAERTAFKTDQTIALLVNCAVCSANIDQHATSIKYCDAALSLDSNSQKATRQRAFSLFALKRFQDAKDWTKKAILLATGDKSLRVLFEQIKAAMLE